MVWHYKAYEVFVVIVLLMVATLIDYGRRIRTLQREVGLNQTLSQATTVLINGLNSHQVSASTSNKPGTSKYLSKKPAPKILHKAKQPTARSSTSNTVNTSEEEAKVCLSRASLQTKKHEVWAANSFYTTFSDYSDYSENSVFMPNIRPTIRIIHFML